MNLTEFTHPEDLDALEVLNAIPILPVVLKKAMDLGVEQWS